MQAAVDAAAALQLSLSPGVEFGAANKRAHKLANKKDHSGMRGDKV